MVAAARERCVDKIEQVEEIEYDEVVSLLIADWNPSRKLQEINMQLKTNQGIIFGDISHSLHRVYVNYLII